VNEETRDLLYAYFRDRELSPHYCQDTLNVVGFESIGIFGAVKVSNPEAR
jgi:hypothetical protein